jgi:hypothetical protein
MCTLSSKPESSHSVDQAITREVEQLFQLNTPTEMMEHLWDVYTGFVHFEKQAGYNPRQDEIFLTFRDLMIFCHRMEKMKAALAPAA